MEKLGVAIRLEDLKNVSPMAASISDGTKLTLLSSVAVVGWALSEMAMLETRARVVSKRLRLLWKFSGSEITATELDTLGRELYRRFLRSSKLVG